MAQLKFFILFLITLCIISQYNLTTVKAALASPQWTSAVNSAMSELATDKSFQSTMSSLGIPFNVPFCTEEPNYPKNPIPSNFTKITICSEPQPPTNLWGMIYKIVGQGLVDKLNKQYKLSLSPSFVLVNTSSGYFNSLRNGVDSGYCDLSVSNTAFSSERNAVINFPKCAFGTTFFAFLRTDLDNVTLPGIDNVQELNRTDVKVSWWTGTLFDRVVTQNVPAAERWPSTTMEGMYSNAANLRVHALLFNALDMISWKNANPQLCGNCYVKVFDMPIPVLVFTSKLTRDSAATPSVDVVFQSVAVLLLLLSLLI